MNHEATTEPVATLPPEQTVPVHAPPLPEVVPLREVLRHIQRDSRSQPAEYLDEAEVLHGGE